MTGLASIVGGVVHPEVKDRRWLALDLSGWLLGAAEELLADSRTAGVSPRVCTPGLASTVVAVHVHGSGKRRKDRG